MIPVSVIVATSPGREPQLARCLAALAAQLHAPFEVIVADDGSSGAAQVVADFAGRLTIRHLWRPNDQSPARSRNAGAAAARHALLVFIDSDILLNPNALAAHANYLTGHGNWLLCGYVGIEMLAASALLPGVPVNWRDKRFYWNLEGLFPKDWILHSSFECAFSGNLSIHRSAFAALGGFDERFCGWGGEDLDFGERAVARGLEIHFLLDAWGEHQDHPRESDFHRRPSEQRAHGYAFRPHKAVPYQVQVFASKPAYDQLEGLIRNHYVPDGIRTHGLSNPRPIPGPNRVSDPALTSDPEA